MNHGDGNDDLTAETRYVFNMARGLATAATPEVKSEYREALDMIALLTDHPAVRAMVRRILTRNNQPAPVSVSGLVHQFIRPAVPVVLAIAVTACVAWAAPLPEESAGIMVAHWIEPVTCAELVDSCE